MKLARNPATPVAALDVAARIESGRADGEIDSVVEEVTPELIKAGDWSAVNFLSPFLTQAYRSLADGAQSDVGMVAMRECADVGPDGRGARDAFKKQMLPTALGWRALWNHETDVIQSMSAEPDFYIVPKSGKQDAAQRHWNRRGNLLLPHRLRLNRMRVAAVHLPERVVGSAWTPCHPYDGGITQALCLYLNSTPGLLALLGGRDNRVPAYPNFSMDTLRSLLVPDWGRLGEAQLSYLTGRFNWLQEATLSPLPDIANDPVRHQIDDAVAEALNMDGDWVSKVRLELSREPSVTDKRFLLD